MPRRLSSSPRVSDSLLTPRRVEPHAVRRWTRAALGLAWRGALMLTMLTSASVALSVACTSGLPEAWRLATVDLARIIIAPLAMAAGIIVGWTCDQSHPTFASAEAALIEARHALLLLLRTPLLFTLILITGGLLVRPITGLIDPAASTMPLVLRVAMNVPLGLYIAWVIGQLFIAFAISATFQVLPTPTPISLARAHLLAQEGIALNVRALRGPFVFVGALRVAISFAVGADASLAWTAGIWGACAPLFGIATYVAYRDIFLHRADNVPARVRVRTWHAAPLGAV